ncbi:MAG: glycosyltransferase family 4 protein [Oligosphaeraceae bacterium]|nr:glycosyltransferase family 4 protein [Oligosphaeraceae bacterium]
MPTPITSSLDVLHVTEACAGGVRRHLQLIIPELQRQGVRNGLWTFSARAEQNFAADVATWEPAPAFVQFQTLPRAIWPGLLWLLRCRLQKIVATLQPRCLHLHAGWAGLLGRSIRWPDTIQLIYSPHAFGILSGQSWLRRTILPQLETRLAERTHAYILVGPDECREARMMKLPEQKLHLIPNALPEDFAAGLLPREQARARLGLSARTQAILVPGRLAWQKGGDILLSALAQTRLPNPHTLFCFCGQGPQAAAWRRMARAGGIAGQVRFMDYLPDLRRLLLAFEAAVLPSRYEGLSYALLECLGAGLPLLVSDLEANLQDHTCHTFAAGDSDSLAQALPQFLASCQTRRPEKHHWTLSRQAEALQKIYAAASAPA